MMFCNISGGSSGIVSLGDDRGFPVICYVTKRNAHDGNAECKQTRWRSVSVKIIENNVVTLM